MRKITLLAVYILLTSCTTAPPPEIGEPLAASQAILTLRGMSCPLCANNVDGRLKQVRGVTDVTIDLETGKVVVIFAEQAPSRNQLETAVKESGFTLAGMELIP